MSEDKKTEILSDLKRILEKQIGISPDKVTLESKLGADLEFDSLDYTELLLEIEDKYEIKIEDKEVDGLKTMGNVVDYIHLRKYSPGIS